MICDSWRPRERGMFKAFGKMSGIDCRRLLIPLLASPPLSAPYFSQFLPVPFPSRQFLETPARQAIIDGNDRTCQGFV